MTTCSQTNGQTFNLIVEGRIAAGKSKFIEVLEQGLAAKLGQVQVIKEPIDQWLELGAFQQFCQDKVNKSYEFQTLAFSTRVQEARRCYKLAPNVVCRISERSMNADKIFAKMLYKSGCFRDYQWKMYQTWCDTWEILWPWEPTHYLYLDPPIAVCQQRVKNRDREGESDIVTFEYQNDLTAEYESFFQKECKKPLLRLTTQADFRTDPVIQKQLVEQVYEFMINN